MTITIKRLAVALGALFLTSCAGGPGSGGESAYAPSGSLQAQFDCADRNHSNYVDRAELVFLHQCGVGEDLNCGTVRQVDDSVSATEEFRLGRRMLEIIDANGDERISLLEFRAHCNSTGSR